MDKAPAAPSLRDIAKKYASSPNARAELEAKVVNGSVGVWGPMPMPPTSVPETDVDTLLKWILSLKQ
jgi:cytochrome c